MNSEHNWHLWIHHLFFHNLDIKVLSFLEVLIYFILFYVSVDNGVSKIEKDKLVFN